MKLRKYSYRFAEEILQHKKYKRAYSEICDICEGCPLPYYPGKSKNQKRLDVVQQLINSYFQVQFMNHGWKPEPFASPQEFDDSLRSDFKKSFGDGDNKLVVQVEVEMGNAASCYRNYFKFQLSFSNDLCDVGLLILPTTTLSKRIDSGVANFEKTVREISSAKLSLTLPILVIGLDDNGTELWELPKEILTTANTTEGKRYREDLIRDYLT